MIFWEKLTVDSADTLLVKNFVEMALSHTVSEIKDFTQKFKMAAKKGGKTFFGKDASRLCRYCGGQTFCQNHFISHCF